MWYRKIFGVFRRRTAKKLKSQLGNQNTPGVADNVRHEQTHSTELFRAEGGGAASDAQSSDQSDASLVSAKHNPRISSRLDRQQLVIGLDFGTAFTKVVVGETRAHFAVPFDPYHIDTNPYLLPGRFFVESANVCTLANNGGREVTELKMRIIEKEFSQKDEAEITAFLALVLRHTQNWLLSNHQSVYGQSQLDWLINIGLPTDSYHDEALTGLYKLFLRAAWSLSQGEQPITLGKVEDLLVELYCVPSDEIGSDISDDGYIGLFPEFVAQITGYVRSTRVQNDLHLLIDIGAGTADISVFNVTEVDDEYRFPIFARAVERLGTSYLMRRRLTTIGHSKNKVVSYHSVPSREQFARDLGGNESEIEASDDQFVDKLFRAIMKCLTYTKDKRYPKSSRWKEGVPTFLCGGGARVDAYQDLKKRLERISGEVNLQLTSLQMPENLRAPLSDNAEYDRLTIAYGLSFDPYDIGDIVKESDIEDVPPDDVPPEPEYMSWYKS